jgi:hypothetical protein
MSVSVHVWGQLLPVHSTTSKAKAETRAVSDLGGVSKCQNVKNINISFSVYNMCAYDRLLYCLRLFNVCSEVSPLGGGVSEHVETKQ